MPRDCYCYLTETRTKPDDCCVECEPDYTVIVGIECCENCIHSRKKLKDD